MHPLCFPYDHPVMKAAAIWHADKSVPRKDWVVVLFRNRFVLDRTTDELQLWVSASQRFELYLDGSLIARGPSRSDPLRWNVSPVVLGKLAAGEHQLAARVIHFGAYAGIGQMGNAAFFLCAAAEAEFKPVFNTSTNWRCLRDESRHPVTQHAWERQPYYVVGAGERISTENYLWDWEKPLYDDSAWPPARIIANEVANIWGNLSLDHLLRPDPIPGMSFEQKRYARVADVPELLYAQAHRWISGDGTLSIAPHQTVRLVLDHRELVNAYLHLKYSGGKGSRIELVSAEAPYTGDKHYKGNRDIIEGKKLWGHRDLIEIDGGIKRTIETLWFRSHRYLEMTVTTQEEALILDDIFGETSSFPLQERATFNPELKFDSAYRTLWELSWRTIRLCAHETFFDCPHYEQAQFPGDTRVQAIYHYLVANEDRLARKAIDDFHASRLADGLTQCRYPSNKIQILPTFSLFWIGMLHDFKIYRGDTAFLEPYLPAAREILYWFERRLRSDGMLGFVEHAPFFDWTKFQAGNAPQERDGGSSLLSLLFADACHWVAQLEKSAGYSELAPRWIELKNRIVTATMERCWAPERQMLADTSSRNSFSVHGQVQAILVGCWGAKQAKEILLRALQTADVTPAGSFYYRYYIAQAFKLCAAESHYFELQQDWHSALVNTGLTTWPESSGEAPRSDCHAWSVTPGIECLQTILGIRPSADATGFDSILFKPTLGPMNYVSGSLDTPKGTIKAEIVRATEQLNVTLLTPVPVTLDDGRKFQAGMHEFRLEQ